PLLSGFTLRSTLLMLYAGIFCAGIGMLLMAKIVECTSATEGSFVYLIKPILATLVAMAVFHEYISTNRAIGIGFFVLASMCVLLPALREMKTEQKKASA
ncbi:MAG: EamA family transporter, partial [Oscillospiraceae bacterium]|nr:EamA family transporter [Oscillospiraceae bacterium]